MRLAHEPNRDDSWSPTKTAVSASTIAAPAIVAIVVSTVVTRAWPSVPTRCDGPSQAIVAIVQRTAQQPPMSSARSARSGGQRISRRRRPVPPSDGRLTGAPSISGFRRRIGTVGKAGGWAVRRAGSRIPSAVGPPSPPSRRQRRVAQCQTRREAACTFIASWVSRPRAIPVGNLTESISHETASSPWQ